MDGLIIHQNITSWSANLADTVSGGGNTKYFQDLMNKYKIFIQNIRFTEKKVLKKII